jgi:hypothetical protein
MSSGRGAAALRTDFRVSLRFRSRSEPLNASAVLALDLVAERLLRRLVGFDAQRLSKLEGLRTARAVLVTGAMDDLPWVDGVAYLGRDTDAPSLLLPTVVRPDVHLSLFERALASHGNGALSGTSTKRWAVSFEPPLLLAASSTRTLDREMIEHWLSERTAADRHD